VGSTSADSLISCNLMITSILNVDRISRTTRVSTTTAWELVNRNSNPMVVVRTVGVYYLSVHKTVPSYQRYVDKDRIGHFNLKAFPCACFKVAVEGDV
jgi:hypothetical protein